MMSLVADTKREKQTQCFHTWAKWKVFSRSKEFGTQTLLLPNSATILKRALNIYCIFFSIGLESELSNCYKKGIILVCESIHKIT